MGLVGKQRSRPGDVGLDPRRGRHRVHDLADGQARLGGLAAAHVAGEVHLNVCGLLVVALGARGGQGITPEVLDVLNVFLVLLESFDDLVVIAVGLRPQRFVALSRIMAELSELNSLNVDPTCIIDWNDTASLGLCDTEWALETTSSCGAMVLATKTMPSQIKTIGNASRWIIRG